MCPCVKKLDKQYKWGMVLFKSLVLCDANDRKVGIILYILCGSVCKSIHWHIRSWMFLNFCTKASKLRTLSDTNSLWKQMFLSFSLGISFCLFRLLSRKRGDSWLSAVRGQARYFSIGFDDLSGSFFKQILVATNFRWTLFKLATGYGLFQIQHFFIMNVVFEGSRSPPILTTQLTLNDAFGTSQSGIKTSTITVYFCKFSLQQILLNVSYVNGC